MAEASAVPEILNQKNYKIWSRCMKAYLLGQDLWDIIEPEEEEEEAEFRSSSALSKNEMKSWRRRNGLALNAIHKSCGEIFLSQIAELESAKEAWDRLKVLSQSPKPKPGVPELQRSKKANQRVDFPRQIDENASDPQQSQLMRPRDGHSHHRELPIVKDYGPFIKATIEGKWSSMKEFLDSHPRAVTVKVLPGGRTALHYVLDKGRIKIAELLLYKMTGDDLEIQDNEGYTALAYGANKNHPDIIPLLIRMIKKIPWLPTIGKDEYCIPVVMASWKSFKDTTRYLYRVTDKNIMSPETGNVGVNLLINCVNIKLYDVASDLVRRYPKLLQQKNGDNVYPIYATSSALRMENRHKKNRPGAKNMSNEDDKARSFVQLICDHVSTFDVPMLKMAVYAAMIEATKDGNIGFITAMLRANRDLIEAHDDEGRGIFFHAIKNRQEKVFNLIYGVIDQKDSLLSRANNYNSGSNKYKNINNKRHNNILHLVAELPSSYILNRYTSPALQMQRELQWFQELWNVAKPRYRNDLNNKALTPHEMFSKTHEKLIDEGQKAMKETAQSCTVVGALIVTIMFAVAFTVPGANSQETGWPILLKKVLFETFLICDALSLYSSITSVLVFLSILTSRYAEDDFLYVLPVKLMAGLAAIFFSITTMMITFCAALALMLDGKLQFILPVVILASIPIVVFLWSMVPLLYEIFMSTCGPSIFDKKTKFPGVEKEEKILMTEPTRVDTRVSEKKEGENGMNNASSDDMPIPNMVMNNSSSTDKELPSTEEGESMKNNSKKEENMVNNFNNTGEELC